MGDTHIATLPDGRRVTYADHGPRTGPVVLNCLGTPESRLVNPVDVEHAERLGFRLLVPDRPGFGGSDPKPGRTLLDWPVDAGHLLDSLGVGSFAVVGGSGGGPYAVACGVLLGDRVSRVALVAPAEPRDAPAHGFVPREPAALRERGETMARLLRDDPAGFYALVFPDLSDADRAQEEAMDQATKDWATAMFREAFRQGADAYVEDHLIVGGPWSDLLPRLTRPTRIWQGDDDNNVPAEATRWLAERIPGAELTLLAGAGHGLGRDIEAANAVMAEVRRWLLAPTGSAA
jgi:pimeloyl-ACP methyl ester carboxylesterase